MNAPASRKLSFWSLALLLGGATSLGLSACDTRGTIYIDGGEPDARDTQFLIQSIELSGTTQAAAVVTVDNVSDQDGAQDTNWLVDFQLDGADQENSLPADNGEKQTHTLRVKSVQTADQQEFHKKVTITLFE